MSNDIIMEIEPEEPEVNKPTEVSIDQAFIALKEAKATMEATHERIKPQLAANAIDSDTLTQIMNEPYTKYNSAFELVQHLLMKSREAHPEAWEALSDPERRRSFINGLPLADLLQYMKVELRSEETEQDIKDRIASDLTIDEFIQLYEDKQPKKKQYRTKARATGIIDELPKAIAVPTLKEFQYATSLYQDGNAYLQPLHSTDGLVFRDGKIYFKGNLQAITEAELQNMQTKQGIDNIDLPMIRMFYSIILDQFQTTGKPSAIIKITIPDLAEYMGKGRNIGKNDIDSIVSKIQQFHNIVGVIHITRNGRPDKNLYPVLNFEGYNAAENTIAFSSPYLNHVMQTVFKVSIRTDKNGKPKLKTNGQPLLKASHSYLINSDITKEKNKNAVENVVIIVQLIEQAGDNVPRIKASTILERNAQLAEAYQKNKNKGRLLNKTFKKTWELLRDKTKLAEVYKDITLPNPDDPQNIPTPTTLKTTIFEFPHKGKKRS